MAKVCKQINRPQVDNSALECETLLSTKCVLSEKDVPVLNVLPSDNLSKLLENLNEYLKNLKGEVKALEYSLRNGNNSGENKPSQPSYDWKKDQSLIKFLADSLAGKVDKEVGKQLSTEDYTTEDKNTLNQVKDKFTNLNSILDKIQSKLGSNSTKLTIIENLVEVLKKQVQQYSLKLNSPITFTDNLDRPTQVVLGETIQVKGADKNINVRTEDHKIEISLAEDLEIKKAKIGSVTLSERGIDVGKKKITNLAKGSLVDDSTDALTAGQFSIIYTEFGRQLTNHERYTQTELTKRELISNKAQTLEGGFDNERYPSIALIKKIKKEIDDLISQTAVEGKEDKKNKTGEINASEPDVKYPNLSLLKKVKADVEKVLEQHIVAIRDLQDQINANDSAVHNAEINPTTAALTLKDKHGVTVGVLNLGFLNNEGTKLVYNSANKTLEMYNKKGDLLSSVPVSAFVSNLVNALGLDGKKIKLLDGAGVKVSEVDLAPLFNLYTTVTKTQEVENKLNQVESNVTSNVQRILDLTSKTVKLQNEKEDKSNKVNDLNQGDDTNKYPTIALLKQVKQELSDNMGLQEEKTETITVKTSHLVGGIVRIELSAKVDDSKWWSVWVNGVVIERTAVTFVDKMMSIDSAIVGYNIEEGDEITVQYKVKK